MFRIALFFSLVLSVSPLKFLCYSPRFGQSHSNFLGKLSDSLIDAGHEVVILSPILNPQVKGAGSDRARIIEFKLPGLQKQAEENNAEEELTSLWRTGESWQAIGNWGKMNDVLVALCNETVNHPGLLDQLRAEQFDAAFGESFDWCMGGLFHLLDIDKFAVTESIAFKDAMFSISQVTTVPAYVPSAMGGSFGDEMTLLQRAFNLFNLYMFAKHRNDPLKIYQKMFEQNQPGFPDVEELMALNSLYFLNSDALVDFPRLSAARMIDIGGIAVSNGFKKLDDKWSSILDLRPKTVFMSFGTYVQAYAMPEEYKETIRRTARAMPDVTFIWKYEKPEHNVTRGIPNLIETTWLPQVDMLRDPRLSAFVTHCGQGSTTEANYAGVPLIVVPNIFDQVRNAFAMRRAGVGLNIHKSDLADGQTFENTVREVLENPKYKNRAVKVAAMLNDKPFSARETFVRNMEFLAKHGPLRQLDHYGTKLNVLQYYLIDIIAVAIVSMILAILTVSFCMPKMFSAICERSRKSKKE